MPFRVNGIGGFAAQNIVFIWFIWYNLSKFYIIGDDRMAEIIKTYKQSIPAMRFIGKKYDDGSHWGEWFANDWFSTVERAMGTEQTVRQLYQDGDAYLGMMRNKNTEPFEYWIGEFVAPDTKVPDGFLWVDFPKSNIGVCWIYGKESEVFGIESECAKKISDAGMEIVADGNDAVWSFERYGCPRFTTPDENGNIILDFCYFVK